MDNFQQEVLRRLKMIEDELDHLHSYKVPNQALDTTSSPTFASLIATGLLETSHGLFTPSFKGTGTAGTFTYSTQQGTYVKIGNVCHAWAHITISAITVAPTTDMTIIGLPFNSAADANLQYAIAFGLISNLKYTAASLAVLGFLNVSSTVIALREVFTNAATVNYPAANFTNAGCNIIFSITYRTA